MEWLKLQILKLMSIKFYAATSNNAARCYHCYLPSTVSHSGPDNYFEPQVWSPINVFKFTTDHFPSICSTSRVTVGPLFVNVTLDISIFNWVKGITLFHVLGVRNHHASSCMLLLKGLQATCPFKIL